MKIDSIKAKEILTSKGSPTIEAVLETEKGEFMASVPSGVSTGKYEAKSLPVGEAIANIENVIAKTIVGKNFESQKQVDQFLLELDGSKNKSRLGANAILAVSIAAARALAGDKAQPLFDYLRGIASLGETFREFPEACPGPAVLCLEGGRHGNGKMSIQEFMVVPQKNSFRENFTVAQAVYNKLKEILEAEVGFGAFEIGVEGAFVLKNSSSRDALAFLNRAINDLGNKGTKIYLDVAASEFYENGIYVFDGQEMKAGELLQFYKEIIAQYPIGFIEDPFSQDDTASWQDFKSKIKNQKSKIIGDDLTVTNPEIIKYAQKNNLCDGVIIKPNQIGTVSEAIEAANLAKSFGWITIVSHRGGETTDSFIADLAVGVGANYIKSGAVSQKERMAKYNRLLEIEKILD